MSKLSYEHTELLDVLILAEDGEAKAIAYGSAAYDEALSRGFLDIDGSLTEEGRRFLIQHDGI